MSPPAATGAAVVLACMSVVLLVPAPIRFRAGAKGSAVSFRAHSCSLAVLTLALVLWSWLSIHRFVLVALRCCVVLGVGRLRGADALRELPIGAATRCWWCVTPSRPTSPPASRHC